MAIYQQANNSFSIQTYVDSHWSDRATYSPSQLNLLLQPDGGRVGIGTIAPSAQLTVSGSETAVNGANAALKLTNTAATIANSWFLRAGGAGTSTPDGGFSIADNSFYRLAITNTGNVGIGTTSPASLLQLGTQTGTQTATPNVLSLGGTYSSTPGTNMKLRLFDDSNASNQFGFGVSTAQLESMVPAGSKFAWFVGGAEKVKIDTNGNVGIGTTSPAAALEVNGAFIRAIAHATGTGNQSNTAPAQIAGRTLAFTKSKSSTSIRIGWTDGVRVGFATDNSACRYEIKVDGSSCSGGAMVYDFYMGSRAYIDHHRPQTLVGYCDGVGVGSHTLTVWAGAVPGLTQGSCYTGWNWVRRVLEAEEIN